MNTEQIIAGQQISTDGCGVLMSKATGCERELLGHLNQNHDQVCAYADLFVASPGLLESLQDLLAVCAASKDVAYGTEPIKRAQARVRELLKAFKESDEVMYGKS